MIKYDEIKNAFDSAAANPALVSESKAEHIATINGLSHMENRHAQIAKDISMYGGAGTPEWEKHNTAHYKASKAKEALVKGDAAAARAHYMSIDGGVRRSHKADVENPNDFGAAMMNKTSRWLEKD